VSETKSDEDLLKSLIGRPTGHSKVVVERGPVAFFAQAVKDDDPVYRDPEAARAAGFSNIPVPPTYPLVMDHWGTFEELQPQDNPTDSPLMAALGPLMARGGLILHGEQEFIYHRPVVVGDVLEGHGKVADAYQKESRGRTMTFVVTETTWKDESGSPVVTSRFNVIHRA
jgi:acyl dehydratase